MILVLAKQLCEPLCLSVLVAILLTMRHKGTK